MGTIRETGERNGRAKRRANTSEMGRVGSRDGESRNRETMNTRNNQQSISARSSIKARTLTCWCALLRGVCRVCWRVLSHITVNIGGKISR
jgi:hypothetical protein